MVGRWIAGPLGLAVVVTLVNAIKPVLIDDTAYLTFARHLAKQPLDPYGFTLHWYTFPDRAFDVLLPPVLPYWLALGIAIFGEHVFLLKLWLFPILLCFTTSLNVLLRRFARGAEGIALPLITLSPAVLPTVNFMLDIPAAALALASLALFTRRDLTWRTAIAAGLLAGIAMQTKYTAMLAPAAILWFGITHRRIRLAILACVVAAAVFGTWEGWLFQKYGESHFLHHLAEQSAGSGNWLKEKMNLIPGLLGHSGLMGFGIALFAVRATGLSNRRLILIAVLWFFGFLCTAVDVVRAGFIWRPIGTCVVMAALFAAIYIIAKRKGFRYSRGSWFLAGWLLLELAGYFVLTPFPAGRRVIGFTLVFGLVAARMLSRIRHERTPRGWMLPFAIWISLLFTAVDTVDAFAEKVLAEQAVRELRNEKRIWYAGHWGFQYYCERAGFVMIVPGQSVLQPGDVVVMPTRTHIGNIELHPKRKDTSWHRLARHRVWDALPRTIPNFYGGNDPTVMHDGERMAMTIYLVVKPYAAPGQ